MDFKPGRTLETDVLVIGSGGTGLRAAIEARRYGAEVLVIDKSVIGKNSNTRYSGGGLKAALPGILEDRYTTIFSTPEEHLQAALVHGEYLNDQELIRILTVEAPARILELGEFGVEHFRDMYYRFHYPHGTGLVEPQMNYAQEIGCSLRPGVVPTGLLMDGERVCGCLGFSVRTGRPLTIKARSVILATGGAGEIYERNDTTANTTGDGYYLAFKAGAEFRDMEIVQFEPFVQAEAGLPMMDRHECEAEFFGILRNAEGEEFLQKYVSAGKEELDSFEKQFGMPLTDIRELVARAMVTEVHEGRGDKGAVLFDLTHVPSHKWSSDIASEYTRAVLMRGFDPEKKPIHVLPGAICTLGGVAITPECETNVPGLYAAGEVAGGVHGAARLGGDALVETIVYGARAGRAAALHARSASQIDEKGAELQAQSALGRWQSLLDEDGGTAAGYEAGAAGGSSWPSPEELQARLKSTMWSNAGPLRNAEGLDEALQEVAELEERAAELTSRGLRGLRSAYETRAMLLTARMVLTAARTRTESRGAHYRLDHPYRDDAGWLKNIFLRQSRTADLDEPDGSTLETFERPVELLTHRPGPVSKFGTEVRA